MHLFGRALRQGAVSERLFELICNCSIRVGQAGFGVHFRLSRTSAFASVRSFRMIATRAGIDQAKPHKAEPTRKILHGDHET
jgi:hypothetical protein